MQPLAQTLSREFNGRRNCMTESSLTVIWQTESNEMIWYARQSRNDCYCFRLNDWRIYIQASELYSGSLVLLVSSVCLQSPLKKYNWVCYLFEPTEPWALRSKETDWVSGNREVHSFTGSLPSKFRRNARHIKVICIKPPLFYILLIKWRFR